LKAEALRLPFTLGAAALVAVGAHVLLYAVLAGVHAPKPFGVPLWLIGDVLVSAAVGAMAWLVVAVSRSGRAAAWRAAWQALAASVLLTAALFVGLVVFFSTIGHQDGCQADGDMPVWVAEHGDCVQGFPRLWDYLWPPDRWFAPSICTGMCG